MDENPHPKVRSSSRRPSNFSSSSSMSTFFLHAFLPFLLDWLCWAGAPTTEAADNFFFGLKEGVGACLLFDFVGAMVQTGKVKQRELRRFADRRVSPVITAIGISTSYSQPTSFKRSLDADYAYRYENLGLQQRFCAFKFGRAPLIPKARSTQR